MASHYQAPKLTLKTDVDYDLGVITQQLVDERMERLRDITATTTQWVIRTREKAIHDALVSLGWTPPPKI